MDTIKVILKSMVRSRMFWLVLGHFIGDYVLQPKWMILQKGQSWLMNLCHAAVYTAAVFLIAQIGGLIGGFRLSLYSIGILLVSHFMIDPLKARWGITNLWSDQALHFLVLVWIAFYFISVRRVKEVGGNGS